jgi:hypothetical protein
MQTCRLVVQLISMPTSDRVTLCALELGIAALHGGNDNVQMSFHAILSNGSSSYKFMSQVCVVVLVCTYVYIYIRTRVYVMSCSKPFNGNSRSSSHTFLSQAICMCVCVCACVRANELPYDTDGQRRWLVEG